jgi:PAS domain S-box-containing protein
LTGRINCSSDSSKAQGLSKRLLERFGRRQRGVGRVGMFVFQFAICCLPVQSSAATASKEVRRVLILHGLGVSSPAFVVGDAQIRSVLESSPFQIELYEETLQNILFSDQASQQEIRQGYIQKYRNRRPDVIIAVGPAPIKFMVDSHDEFAPNTPIVFCASTEEQVDYLNLDSHFTGAWRTVDPARTLDAALRLRPDIKHVVVVGGVLPYDRRLEAAVTRGLGKYESRLELTYLMDEAMPALLEKLSHLPEHTMILYTALSQDAAGTHFIDETQSIPMIVGAANAPVFVLEDTFVGQGTMGGYVTPSGDEGRVAGEIAVRILKGEKPQNIPTVKDTNVYMFDWRALRRWGSLKSGLPPGSVLLYQEPTIWQSYWKYVIGVACLFVLETLLVLALLWQRKRRKKVEESLVERLMFETLLSDLSTTFINLPEERVEANLEESLGRMGASLQTDRITLFEFSEDRTELTERFTWRKEGLKVAHPVIKADKLPWWAERTLHGEALITSDVSTLPAEASSEKAYLQANEIISVASVPLEVGGNIFGAMTFASTTRRIQWSEDLIQRLKMLAEIFSNALGRKHAEARRSESEERFRLVANTAPVLIWMAGTDMLCNYFNQSWLDFTGRAVQDELGNGWAEGVHPADLQRCMETYIEAFEQRKRFAMEFRLRRHDGEFRWILDIGVPRFNAHESFAGFIGSAIDVTGHKEAEQTLATVSGKLIQAQEEERHRIARELHDDISQRIALLSLEIQGLGEARPKSSVELRDRAERLLKYTSQLSSDIHALSHRLHSSKLDYMGVVAAIAGFCSEIKAQKGQEIDFEHTDVPRSLPQDISLCLFRVLQEGLHNAVRYSGSRHVKVELQGTPDAVQLIIRDSGSGFDPEVAMKNGGLGLISMRERVGLVKGTISIESKPQVGTEIRVNIPIPRALAASANPMGSPEGGGGI